MQSDGNLVVYTSSGRAVWMSGASRANRLNATTTSNYGMLQAGEYLHSASGRYQVAMQVDGNFVISDGGTQLWNSNTASKMQLPNGLLTGDWLVLQSDGNLVMNTGPWAVIWSSGTWWAGSHSYLVMQDNGWLVLYNSSGHQVRSRY